MPSILIIAVDALRADKLGCYGYERETSPAIDEFARDPDAVLYRRHYSQGAWTKPSTASLFTGLFAFQHGVVWGHQMGELPDRAGSFTTQVLGDGFETIAERLREVGFYTLGVVKSHHLLPEYGFAQGFDDYIPPEEAGDDNHRVKKTVDLIRRAPGYFFGYLHLNGVHHPFPPKARHPAFMNEYGFDYDEEGRIEQGVDFTVGETKHAIGDGELTLEPEDVRFLNLVYDAKLRKVDEEYIGPLIRALKHLGVYDNTLIILTADHGEELYDHEGYAHGHALWDEVVRVPLIVKFPRGRKPEALGKEVHAATQSVDLIPSLLSFLGHPVPRELPGSDIFHGSPRDFAYSETPRAWALVQGGYKLIFGEGVAFLSEQRSDPNEQVNLAETEPDRLHAMRVAAETLRDAVALEPQEALVKETVLDDEALKALRSLGYIR